MQQDSTSKDSPFSHQQPHKKGAAQSLDEAEIARFSAIAAEWWDMNGKFKPLHQLGPARLSFITDEIEQHFFARPDQAARPASQRTLNSLTMLDIGCGGGLICEPLTRLGADITGIDPGFETINVARQHAKEQGLEITYRQELAETLVDEGAQYDVVLALEVIEHVLDVAHFLSVAQKLLKPNGLMLVSTLNRTLKSFALAIIGAEYILGWLPRGTHQWDRFITPQELDAYLHPLGLELKTQSGMVYNPLKDTWSLSKDVDVNYIASVRAR